MASAKNVLLLALLACIIQFYVSAQVAMILKKAEFKQEEKDHQDLQKRRERLNLIHGKLTCINGARFTPCACTSTLSTSRIHSKGKVVEVMFPEYHCVDAINRKRKEEGRIRNGYTCAQLTARQILYRDVWNKPIEVQIQYRAGCELRCTQSYCKGVSTD